MLKKMIMYMLLFLSIFGGKDLTRTNDINIVHANDEVNSGLIVPTKLEGNNPECTTEEGYTDVVTDLTRLGMYSGPTNSSLTSFITLDQVYNSNNEIETFLYLDFKAEFYSPNFVTNIAELCTMSAVFVSFSTSFNTDSSLIDDSNLKFTSLELVSSENNSNLKKYKILNGINVGEGVFLGGLDNLDDSIRRYYISSITFINRNTVTDYSSNYEFKVDKAYIFDNNLYKVTFDAEEDSNIDNNPINPDNNPVEDLEKDENFDSSNYPVNSTNYTLSLIQIGETEYDQLVLYIYNPSKRLTATSINMSIDRGNRYKVYYLRKESTSGTIDKYVVDGYKVTDDNYRYYYIASLYRKFDSSIDKDNTSDLTTTDEISYRVGFNYCCYYNKNNELIYEKDIVNLVEIEPIITSYVRYDEGGFVLFGDSACDAHFIGFNVVNYDVKKIIDADISFKVQKYKYHFATGGNIIREYDYDLDNDGVEDPLIEYNGVFLSKNDNVFIKGDGLIKAEYKWNRIVNSSTFISEFKSNGGELKETAEADILKSSWVFAFYESDYIFKGNYATAYDYTAEKVKEVVILRLHFVTPGGTYNLGVVSNKTGSTGESAGSANEEKNDINKVVNDLLSSIGNSLNDMLNLFLVICGFILVGCLLISLIIVCLPSLFKAFIKLITSPFKLLKNNRRNRFRI